MGKHLVLIGAGHAHMVTLENIDQIIEKGHCVTVIGPSAYHYYSGMGPGMLGTTYTAEDIRFASQRQVEEKGGTFLLDAVTHLDPVQKTIFLASGDTVSYDVLSCNAGSYVPHTCVGKDDGDIFSVKPIETLLRAQERIVELTASRKCTIAIVGGGPSSAEIAGNILQLCQKKGTKIPAIHIYSGREFMARFPLKIRNMVRSSLIKRHIQIHEGFRVTNVKTGEVKLDTMKVSG